MKHKLLLFLSIILFLLMQQNGNAQVLSDELQNMILTANPNEYIRAVISMKNRVQISELASLSAGLSRKDARIAVINQIKEFAAQSQYDVQNYLLLSKANGGTKNYKSILITNQIIINARPSVFQSLQNRSDIHIIYIEHPSHVLGSNTWNVSKINAPEVWSRIGYEGNGVIVGVLDEGTDYGHSDLHNNVWNNLGEDADGDGHTLEEVGGNWVLDPGDIDNIDNDGNDKVDDLIGWNFEVDNNNPDPDYHGTFVAGIIAGDGSDGTQTGVAPKAKIMILKVVPPGGLGVTSNTYDAIFYGANNGADILNLSIGWSYGAISNEEKAFLRYACDVAYYAGLVVCVISGNGGPPVPYNIWTPGDVPSVITVGATDENDIITSYSSIGPITWQDIEPYNDYPYPPGLLKPDVVAPGGTAEPEYLPITSLQPGGGYRTDIGTSFAAPAVSGTIALMLEANPLLTPAEVKEQIQQMAIDKGEPGKDPLYGSGRIDAFQSVMLALASANKSESSEATFSNNARHITKGAGYLHEIFSSGEEIFYRRSPDSGQRWDNTIRISGGNYEDGENGNPCINYLEFIDGELTNKLLFATWEREISSTQYEVWVSINNDPDAQSLNWSEPQLLATVNISASQTGAMPVISHFEYEDQMKLMVVYCTNQGLKYQVSDDLGSEWSAPILIPLEYPVRYPSLTTGGTFLSLVYDYSDHSNGTYSRIYNGTSWSAESYTSGITGTVYNGTPSVTIDANGDILGVWKGQIFKGGEDPYSSIVFRMGFSNNTWDEWFEVFEHKPMVSSISPSISYFDYDEEYGIKIVYGNSVDIVKQFVYNGSSWLQPDIVFEGSWPNISDESHGSGDPIYFWTSPEGPPYQVELSDEGGESLSKSTPSHSSPLESIQLINSRRAVIRDQQSGTFLAVDVDPLIIRNAAGEEIILPFKNHSLNTPLNISLLNIGDYLGTDTLSLSKNVQNLQLKWSASVFIDEDSTGNLSSNLFKGNYLVYLQINDVNNPTFSTTVNITTIRQANMNIGNFAGKSVFIKPKIQLNNLPVSNLDFGVGNVYSPVSSSQNKELIRTANEEDNKIFALKSNYPNPFNPSTTIHYQVAKESKVTLTIYNILGQKINTLVNEKVSAGDYHVIWDRWNNDGKNVASGIYFLKMMAQTGEKQFVDTQKLILMK